jgi:hypothetical protein
VVQLLENFSMSLSLFSNSCVVSKHSDGKISMFFNINRKGGPYCTIINI